MVNQRYHAHTQLPMMSWRHRERVVVMINDEKYRAHFFPTSPLLSPTLMRSQGACCTSREPEIFHLLAFSPPNDLDLRSRDLQRYYSSSLVHNLIWSSFNSSHYQIVIWICFWFSIFQYLSNSNKITTNTETTMLSILTFSGRISSVVGFMLVLEMLVCFSKERSPHILIKNNFSEWQRL